MLIALIISSTDAAAVFSLLRRPPLQRRVAAITELESAANDPMAILLTVLVVDSMANSPTTLGQAVPVFVWKFAVAPALAWAVAMGAVFLFNRLRPLERGHYYTLSLAVTLLVFGLAQSIHTIGMLAVFVAGLVMGNQSFIHKQGVSNFSAPLAGVANIGMFILLGLQVFPREGVGIWSQGVLVFLVLALFARPAAVWLSTLGMGLNWREKVFISWAGLRGAVPIVLVPYPIAAGLPRGEILFNLTFFAVLLSVALQGTSLAELARWLRLVEPAKPIPPFQHELSPMSDTAHDSIVVDLPGPLGAPGLQVADLSLPAGAVITLMVRQGELVIPRAATQLEGFDQVTVLAEAADEVGVRAILARAIPTELASTAPHSPRVG